VGRLGSKKSQYTKNCLENIITKNYDHCCSYVLSIALRVAAMNMGTIKYRNHCHFMIPLLFAEERG